MKGEKLTLMKIFSLIYKNYYYEMEKLEQTMGMMIHQLMTEFVGVNKSKQFIFVHCEIDNPFVEYLPFSIIYDNNQMIETLFLEPIVLKQ